MNNPKKNNNKIIQKVFELEYNFMERISTAENRKITEKLLKE
jgi:Mg2+ and Co2+ transporter CorA